MADFKYHVFLSHNSADKPAVEELAVRLRREGIEPWLDKWNLVPGDAWQPVIERALDDCATCAVVIGSGGFGVWQNEEMRAAIARRVTECQGQFRVIPILLPGVDRPERGKLPSFLLATTWVEFRRSLEDAEAFHRLICGIKGKEPGAGPGGAIFEGACPYRGLEVFDVEHAPFFFGREALTEWLVNELRPRATGQENRFLAVLGASGSGKSSLGRAGMVATLKKGALDGSGEWPTVILKPGRDPLESLSVSLAGLPSGASLVKDARDLLNIKVFGDDAKSLHTFARLALRDAPRSRRLFVLVDQMEEVFTLCEDAAERRAFFDNLLFAATVADGQTIVVLTMRADFYGKCASYPALAAAMSDHHLLVGPMTEEELARAIERPALLAGGELEPGLLGMLLKDVEGQPGSLPLLEFTLMELWQRREGRRPTSAAYKAIGGLQGALKNRADDVLGQFDEHRRELCRQIFLRLTQPGEGIEDTKRRASFGELVPSGADPLVVESVVRRLADARLITTEGSAEAPGEGSVEVAHEALIRGWGRLRDWIDADRAGLRLQRQLTEAAREWQASRRESSLLYRGSRLTAAKDWSKTHPDALNRAEALFLAASLRRRRAGKLARIASLAALLALAFAVWEGLRWQHQTHFANLARATNSAVEEARQLSLESRFDAAVKVLQAAESQLDSGPPFEPLRRQVASAKESYAKKHLERDSEQRDRKLVEALDEARMLAAANAKDGGGDFDFKAAIAGYRTAFRDARIDIDTLPSEKAAELIHSKPTRIRETLAAVLDDWAWRAEAVDKNRLRSIARSADPDPYRLAIRDASLKNDRKALLDRAHDPQVDHLPAFTLHRLAGAISYGGNKDEWRALNEKAVRMHPHDFWLNKNLAHSLDHASPPRHNDAIRYHQAAVALRPDSPGANRELGWTLALTGHMDDALFWFDKALALEPRNARTYVLRGGAWFANKKHDKAITDYGKALEIDPKYYWAYSSRGTALRFNKEYDKAIADYGKAIELNPKSFWAYYQRGITWHDQKEWNKAIADYNKAIERAPENPVLYKHRAMSFSANREMDNAIADYDKAIELDPKNPVLYENRAMSYSANKVMDNAIADYNKAIELDPKEALAYYRRGDAWLAKHLEEKAITDYNKAIELAPKFAAAYVNRGYAWFLRDKTDPQRIADYTRAIELDPKFALAYYNRGDAWYEKREWDKAIADFDHAIALEPKIAARYNNRGNAWRAKHEYDKAITDYDKAIELDAKFVSPYVNRGNTRFDQKEMDKAIADFDDALNLDPKHASAHTGRGNVLRARHNYGQAIAEYDQAIALDPNYAPPYNGRAWIWATCSLEKYRYGKKAVESATRACELTDWRNRDFLATLAVSCAQAGDFEAAIKWEEKVVGLPAKDDPRRKLFESRLALFQAKQPFHEEPPQTTPPQQESAE
jgi:tetratricopeptide (TPR) repeat protein